MCAHLARTRVHLAIFLLVADGRVEVTRGTALAGFLEDKGATTLPDIESLVAAPFLSDILIK